MNESGTVQPAKDWAWIGDVLFERPNRSVKHIYDGDLLILRELAEWNDVKPRFIRNILPIVAFSLAILFNFVLMMMSFTKKRRSFHYKSRCIIAHLAFTNIVLSCGFLLYTFLVDIYYDVDSFNTLIDLNAYSAFAQVWPLAKKIVHNEMVENFINVQSLILLLLSIDRYFSLFPNYSPFIKKKCAFCVVALLPYLFGLIVFDHSILIRFVSANAASIISLCSLTIPTLLALVFTVCSSVRLIQERAISNPNHDLSCTITLLVILFVQLFEKCGLFLELLHANYMIEIVTGTKFGDDLLRNLLETTYITSHYLLLFSPLYQAIAFLFLTKYYRHGMATIGEKFIRLTTCRRKPKLDYSSETMRSIIEQNRNRQLSRYGYLRT
ncbi:hypothetical protein M3Y97_00210300 [Aphelenchoides bicaudatus]|nr:hypothetical protein M3Y97_00210300 [Aphelenchoides bicaudatus]